MSLIPYTISSPGRWGMNLQEQNQPLLPYWATVADGMVLNDSRQLAARGSISITTTLPASATLLRIFDYIDSAGAEIVISTTATKILKTVGDLTAAGNNITSTTAPTNGYWKFANFNGKVLGWQASHTPIRWSGAGVFTDIVAASGTLPTGDAMCAAFGRVWAVRSDGQTIGYSALLDETKWAAVDGGGTIDMRNVWTQGMDTVTAIAAFGSNLIVFGRRHIIFYSDGQGSSVGIDPTQMFVVDTIEGTGCVSRDSVQSIGEGDLVFESSIGLQSLGRVVSQKDNPLTAVSWQIQDRISVAINTELVSGADLRTWTGTYDIATGQYKLVHATTGDVYVFHFKNRTQDDKGRDVVPVTIWDTAILTNIRQFVTMRNGVQYVTGGLSNHINTYSPSGTTDNGISPIATEWQSGWVDMQNEQADPLTKTLKFAQVTTANPAAISSVTTLKYGFDFTTSLSSLAAAESASTVVRPIYDPTGQIEGRIFKLGVTENRGGGRSLQEIVMHMKLGRVAFSHNVTGQGVVTVTPPSSSLQLLVAVSDSNTSTSCVATSMNGFTWTARTAIQKAWKSVCYGSGPKLVVAVATADIMSSPDGIVWTARTDPGAGGGGGGWRSVCYSPELGIYVAVGSLLTTQRVMKSLDGITWSLVTTPANCDVTWDTVIWNPVLRAFVAGSGTGGTNRIMTSPDGVTWTLRTTSNSAVGRLAVSTSGIVVGIDTNNNLSYTYGHDGVNWPYINADVNLVSSSTAIAYSPDLDLFAIASGVAVNGIVTAPPAEPLVTTKRPTVGFGYIAAIGSDQLAMLIFINSSASNDAGEYSTNGTSWTTFTMPSTQNWFAACETEAV